MFNFVEQPVTISNPEFAMFNVRSDRPVIQGGLQPVAFVQEDIRTLERPRSLVESFFGFHRRRG